MKRTRSLVLAATTATALGGLVAVGQAPASAVEPCFSAGVQDLNGDGFSDAVVGDPHATVGGQAEAGRIVVLYGDADGRVGQGARQVLTQASLGLPVEAGDHFGWSVAVAPVDMDSCWDVVVGAPGETLGGQANAGTVHVVYGSKAGLDADTASEELTQGEVAGTVEEGDRFGAVVVAGENLGQDTSVVAVGAPGEDLAAGQTDAGAAHVLNFSDTVLVQPRLLTQHTGGIPGDPEAGDRFGASLALGVDLVDESGSWELVVGTPSEDIGARADAGTVTVVTGIQGFPPTTTWTARNYTQDSPGVPGTAETGDQFGYSLATTRREIPVADGRRLVVGSPGEKIGPDANAGQVNLFSADGSGLVPGIAVSQDTAGVGDATEGGDRFGHSVALVQAAAAHVAVGVPTENVGSVVDAGAMQVFAWSTPSNDVVLTQDSAGAAGSVAAGRRYGSPVVAVEGSPERVLAVGNGLNGTGTVHVVPRAGGFAARSWVPGSGGVPGGASRFGFSVGSSH